MNLLLFKKVNEQFICFAEKRERKRFQGNTMWIDRNEIVK